MGAAVSDWRLARAVSVTGQLGVVSGTALATVMARRLQLGDPDGACRRALAHFPIRSVTDSILADYFIEGGKQADAPFDLGRLPNLKASATQDRLTVVANFVEVFLARKGTTAWSG